MKEIIKKIKEKGYWNVIIRPTEYAEKRIPNKDKCERIIMDAKVMFRGWDYPHLDKREGIFRSGPDSIASVTDWPEGGHVECWEFYTSGQFTHYFTMREDYQLDEGKKKWIRKSFSFANLDKNHDRFFSLLSTLYSITEIFFFAANIAKLTPFNELTEIIIELGKTKGRTLFFWGEGFRHLRDAYTCRYEPILEERILDTAALLNDPASPALDLTIDIFKEFNWKKPNKEVFLQDQKKFLRHG